ncbi:MAG: sulfur oxidation c-type cytochrome SoxA [Betaproteobacteria bacterium]|jgi:sulfur-oxidizing protein SoxA
MLPSFPEARRVLPLGRAVTAGVAGFLLAVGAAGHERSPGEEIARYRQMLEEGNPAELLEMRGEELWRSPRGPAGATLEGCDLGLGPGVLDGAYAQLPRYFADTDRVEDVESRLVSCITALQGVSAEEAARHWYRSGSEVEALATFVAAKSRGFPIQVPAAHPREAEMLSAGADLFYRRSGPLDFSCATCHAQEDRRIRLQELPNFENPASARGSMTVWPAYRVSQSAVWTLERRLIDCIRQMRHPEPAFGSDAVIALEVYLQHQATGGIMQAPGIKR